MRAQGRGRILTVVTDFAVMMRPSFTAYGGAKAASESFTAGLAVELVRLLGANRVLNEDTVMDLIAARIEELG